MPSIVEFSKKLGAANATIDELRRHLADSLTEHRQDLVTVLAQRAEARDLVRHLVENLYVDREWRQQVWEKGLAALSTWDPNYEFAEGRGSIAQLGDLLSEAGLRVFVHASQCEIWSGGGCTMNCGPPKGGDDGQKRH